MQKWQRQAGILTLLALFIMPVFVSAQDSDSVTVVGSGVVAPLIEALNEASGASATLAVNVTGTNTGFSEFCQGLADVAGATRPISIDEDANCVTNVVEYAELLIGHQITAIVANPDVSFTQCLTGNDLNAIFAPSAAGTTTNWNQIIPDYPDLPITVVAPNVESANFAILDNLVEGDGINADAQIQTSDADVISAVGETSGAIGVTSLKAAVEAGDTVQILDLDAGEVPGCQSASAENVENRLYPAANSLYAYVNRASLGKPGLQDLVNFAVGADAAAVVETAGFTAPTADAQEINVSILEGTQEGSQPSRRPAPFEIPPGVAGQVNIAGSPVAFDFLQNLTTSFTGTYPSVTTDLKLQGEPAGFRRLCNGEIDIAVAYTDLTDEQASNCEANNISTVEVNLGSQATILVANANTDFLGCLRTEHLTSIWGAGEEPATTWNQIDESFAETPVTLFAPSASNQYVDLILLKGSDSAISAREATEVNPDPLYRAAATANVEGALTYMSWQEYQQVLGNNQANIQLVGIDSGSGCVTPSEATIADGSYPLSRPGTLIISEFALSRPEVQSLVWYLLSDENYSALQNAGFVGVDFGDLEEIRANLQTAFAEATAAAAATPPEVTPEAGAESTAEATTEPSADSTAEATTAPESDVTAEVTEATAEEATEAADATAEATE
jgi:phosphate transport system substrate-binding protein